MEISRRKKCILLELESRWKGAPEEGIDELRERIEMNQRVNSTLSKRYKVKTITMTGLPESYLNVYNNIRYKLLLIYSMNSIETLILIVSMEICEQFRRNTNRNHESVVN